MKQTFLLSLILTVIFGSACGGGSAPKKAEDQPAANAETKKPDDGFYPGKGKVTQINLELASVELDHEEIVGLMPAMKMEFSVKDKASLSSFAVGDEVTFTVENKEGKQTIIAIGK